MNVKESNKKLTISFGIYFFIVVAFITIRLLSTFGIFDGLGSWSTYLFSGGVQIGLLLCSGIFLFSALNKQKIRKTLKFYQIKKISWKAIIICLIMGIVVFIINVFGSSFFSAILKGLGYERSGGSLMTSYPIWLLLLNLFFIGVLPAICEEVVHRGMLLRSMKGFGFWKAILISSLLFGLLHLNIEQFFYATLIGLFLGYITSICGTIWPAVIIHFMNNALSVFLTFARVRGISFANIFDKINNMLVNNLAIGIIFIILLVVCLLYVLYLLTIALFIDSARTTIKRNKKIFDKMIHEGMVMMEENAHKGGDISILIDPTKGLDVEDIPDMFILKKNVYKIDIVPKILIISSVLMTLAITIFSFVWGVI